MGTSGRRLRRAAMIAVLLVTAPSAVPRWAAASDGAPGAPDDLTVDGLATPIGIDDTPAFAWRVQDTRRGAGPSGHRPVVSGAPRPGWGHGPGAAAGEAFGYPDGQYYQAVDVHDLLRSGAANAIGALTHWSGVWKGRPAGASGLIVQLAVEHADGTRELLVSDATWKVLRAPWLPSNGRNQEGDPVGTVERFDGTREPVGWAGPDFDDRLWTAATAIGRHPTAPWTHLVSERTRIVEEPLDPVRVTTLADGSVVADYGRVVSAVPKVT